MGKDFTRLLSGSDMRGTAIAAEGQSAPLDAEAARRAGYCFVNWLSARLKKEPGELRIALGHDSRLSAEALTAGMVEGIAATGAAIVYCGLCTTPAMFMATQDTTLACDGAVMITASHLPFDRNGFKFMTQQGGLESKETRLLTEHMAQAEITVKKPNIEKVEYLAQYAKGLRSFLQREIGSDMPLQGLKIVVDAGNGASGFYAAAVLEPLGADTRGSQFLEPDGHFPNHAPNPESQEAMDSICAAVKRAGADLGIIFDADGDRAAIVDHAGEPINRNRLVALLSAVLLKEEPGATIVTDSITSRGLTEFIHKLGGVHRRFKRGYKNVIDEAIRLNSNGINCPLAIETSGHAALRENYFLDDGAYMVSRLLVEAARHKEGQLTDLIRELEEPMEEKEVRIGIDETGAEGGFRVIGLDTIDDVTAAAQNDPQATIALDNQEGVRISFALDGRKDAAWLLLRLSLHDPVLPLNIESDVEGGCRRLAGWILRVLEDRPALQLDSLRKAAQ